MSSKNSDNIPKALEQKDFGYFIGSFPKGISFIDLETTGLSPIGDEIIEVGVVKISPKGKIEKLSALIKPKKPIPPKTTAIHGITDEEVENSPSVSKVLPQVLKFLGDTPIVAHNSKFDLGFIIASAFQEKIKLPKVDILCTCQLAKKLFPELERHSLKFLCEEFDILNENHHRALNDAWVCFKLFQKLSRSPNFSRDKALLFNLKDYQNIDEIEVPQHIEKYRFQIFNQVPLLMRYRGGTIKMEYRPIKPTSILLMPSGPVLYALCLVSGMYKTFGLKKIKELQNANEMELENLIEEGKKILQKQKLLEKENKRNRLL